MTRQQGVLVLRLNPWMNAPSVEQKQRCGTEELGQNAKIEKIGLEIFHQLFPLIVRGKQVWHGAGHCSRAPGYLAHPLADCSQRLMQLAMGRCADISADAFQMVPGRQRLVSITLARRAASATVSHSRSILRSGSLAPSLFCRFPLVRFLGKACVCVLRAFNSPLYLSPKWQRNRLQNSTDEAGVVEIPR